MRGFHGRRFLLEELECVSPCKLVKSSIPTVVVLSVGVFGAAFLIISYLALRRFASWRWNSPPRLPPNTANYSLREGMSAIDHPVWLIRSVGLPRSVIESMESVSYKKGEGMFVESNVCSVCLSEFEDGERVKVLPKCSHAFHVACIDTWLGSHTNCPLCRASVLVAEEGTGEIGGGGAGLSDEGLVTDQEMEPAVTVSARRSVSLDSSSTVEGEKETPFSTSHSQSMST